MEVSGGVEQRYIELKKKYSIRAGQYNDQLKLLSNKIVQLGWLRLFVFIGMIATPSYLYALMPTVALVFLLAFAICFGILIKRSIVLKKIRQELQFLKELNLSEVQALDGNWNDFETGDEFINPQHDFSYDLDLFGQGSFYQYINRTSTLAGKELLAEKLTSPTVGTEHILKQQNILRELSNKLDFRQYFYAKGKSINESLEDLRKIESFKEYQYIFLKKSRLFRLAVIAMPWLFLASFLLAFAGLPAGVSGVLFVVNLIFVASHLKTVNQVNQKFSSLTGILQKYAILTDAICSEEFGADEVRELSGKLVTSDSLNASRLIKQLSGYMNQFDQRNGMIAGVLLNGMLLWDFKYVLKIEKWIVKYNSHIFNWIDIVHEFDALNSMAGYVYNHPDFIYPEPCNEKTFSVSEIGHPLLGRDERVCNDYDFKKSIFALITGANMSGKSTFLRTVGLNLVIARCGMTICAKDMKFKAMSLITNMRTTDSLMKHESYFFAELKKLKYIIKELNKGNDVFIILDEILKGTNSKDKTYGSMELITHLLSLNAFGMIATHDLELGVLQEETKGKIVNQCFEVENRKNKLYFDYKLHAGVTQNHNATFLMKQMGIIKN
ncbi:hypothetical protein E9993_03585 [Labilibacter sediminis]|nr:hypothetical protein E9993_03585 [Labilibacter sediminis]